MTVQYQGLDCIADKSRQQYMAFKVASQQEIPWASQANYAKYTVYFGVVVIFLALLKQLYYRFRDYTYRSSLEASATGGTNAVNSLVDVVISYGRYVGYKPTSPTLRFYLSFPATWGSTLFMGVSSFYLLCYCFIPHFWYRGCAGFGSPPLAVRAGMMSTALMPFIYVLAGKSNMITLLTGISYEKLNAYHQFVGVAAFVLSIVHAVPFVYQDLQEGGSSVLHHNFTTDFYYISGIPPLILLGLLCILSKAWIRKRLYEFFLHLHWMMGIALVGTLIWHIDYALGAQNYMWGAIAFWGTQIIYRLLTKTAFRPNAMFLKSRVAHLQKLDENVYRIDVPEAKDYNWKPGQHCFLRFKGWRVLDSHPFSISSASNNGNGMKFIVVPQRGLTGSHYRELDKMVEINKKVYIDGAYGGTFRDPTKFDKIVLVASGSGVTATLPFLSYLASHGGDNIKCLNFIWVIRQTQHHNWIRQELDRCQQLLGSKLQIDIRACHNATYPASASASDLEKQVDAKPCGGCSTELEQKFERPNITKILYSMASSFSRRNMVICSGSDSMKREVSNAVSNLQTLVFNNDFRNTNVEEIYLHTESFGW
ncbi:uncharacterized protein LODBEIA_P58030 [Lodderomyces beijingensis]|uniref:ferric-chelate reductase (NADPH) n=1 Tax=Lodderomyces beijingensis TaxID=1775926 RepID=A0ABP0ZTU8_9ASCO